MTQTQTKTPAAAFFEEVGETLQNLYMRWLDESAYENINDYAAPLLGAAEWHGIENLRMTKRPFGCTFRVGLKLYKMTANSRGVGYKLTGALPCECQKAKITNVPPCPKCGRFYNDRSQKV